MHPSSSSQATDLPNAAWIAYAEMDGDLGRCYQISLEFADDPHLLVAYDHQEIAAQETLLRIAGRPAPVRWEVRGWDDIRALNRFIARPSADGTDWMLGEL